METVTNAELLSIQGGDWDWDEFFGGVTQALAVTGVILAVTATGPELAVAGASLAIGGALVSIVSYYL